MRIAIVSVALVAPLIGAQRGLCADNSATVRTSESAWSAPAAAQYLDSRAKWWVSWPAAQRDHGTVCISCHTMLPYALSRPLLSVRLHQTEVPAAEEVMLAAIRKRVALWPQVAPYYNDAQSGPGKSRESRSTESVLNALVLASLDANQGHLSSITRSAFDAAWALQLKSGPNAGAWDWQVFHLSPWEGAESQYQGATFMALAIGRAPDRYGKTSTIQPNLRLLRSYLQREFTQQPLLNRVVLLWASARVPGLLSRKQKQQVVESVIQKQHADGGWNLASLGSWTRSDGTPEVTDSDGYGTAIVTLALEQARVAGSSTATIRGLTWLKAHQNQTDGSWRAYSLNKKRDPDSNVGRFMTDAATGYAVLAIAGDRRSNSGSNRQN